MLASNTFCPFITLDVRVPERPLLLTLPLAEMSFHLRSLQQTPVALGLQHHPEMTTWCGQVGCPKNLSLRGVAVSHDLEATSTSVHTISISPTPEIEGPQWAASQITGVLEQDHLLLKPWQWRSRR